MKRAGGFTLIEAIAVLAIGGIVFGLGLRAWPGIQKSMLYNRVRQQAANEARATMDMVRSTFSHGLFSTYAINSPDDSHPNADITFSNAAGTVYEISLSIGPVPPANSVFLRVTPPAPATSNVTILAQNVSVFNFNPDPNDPAGIIVTYISETTMDNSQTAESMYRITLPPQSVRMGGS